MLCGRFPKLQLVLACVCHSLHSGPRNSAALLSRGFEVTPYSTSILCLTSQHPEWNFRLRTCVCVFRLGGRKSCFALEHTVACGLDCVLGFMPSGYQPCLAFRDGGHKFVPRSRSSSVGCSASTPSASQDTTRRCALRMAPRGRVRQSAGTSARTRRLRRGVSAYAKSIARLECDRGC